MSSYHKTKSHSNNGVNTVVSDANAADNNDINEAACNFSSLNCSKMRPKCTRCGNLVEDPSFEIQSFGWFSSNVSFSDNSVYEGAILANLGPGTASLSQDVSLEGACEGPLFFSFNSFTPMDPEGSENVGILIAEITWLDDNFNTIGLGLRMLIPADRLNNKARITFFAQTETPPDNAKFARIAFTKGQGISETLSDIIAIDGVVLAPMAYRNLIKNGDFEANLFNWVASPGDDTAFLSSYKESLEGAGHAQTHYDGKLIQDVNIRNLPCRTPFLLSFAVQGIGPVTLQVRVEWLNSRGTPIGCGLNLDIPNATLGNQENYLSYLNVTCPSVPGTATARIIFCASVPNPSNFVRLDQVIFAPVLSGNLIANPSFENGLNNWNHNLINLGESNDVYEGRFDAGLGQIGGALWQDVELGCPEGICFLLCTGLGFRQTSESATFGTLIIKVIWLDRNDREIGVGLNLIVNRGMLSEVQSGFLEWVPYIGITDPAPAGTAKARILFSKTDSQDGYIEIDNVTFARIV